MCSLTNCVNFSTILIHLTDKLIPYLPFNNDVLRNLRFMLPSSKSSGRLEKWIVNIATAMPKVVYPAELEELRLEVRVYQTSTPTIKMDEKQTINDYWRRVLESVQCTLLTNLIRTCLILPHGNAEVERHAWRYSCEKAQKFRPANIEDLTVIKSDIVAQQKIFLNYFQLLWS